LQINWEEVVPKHKLSFILGNPPFYGKQFQTKEQKEDMKLVFSGVKAAGIFDYVAAWYIRASQYIQNTQIKVAFVSTNSISQGEQVGILWKELFNNYKIKIQFAHRTFKWSNEAKGNAAVHVVIVGFANFDIKGKRLFNYENIKGESHEIKVKNINPYLVQGDDIPILKRRNPICNVPDISFGNMPNDGGNFLFSDEEKNDFLDLEPEAEKYIKPLLSAREFLNGKKRWCLWLENIAPQALSQLKEVRKRVEAVKLARANSSREATKKLAAFPTLFGEIRQPDSDFILIPRVSSENRKYIPIDFFDKNYVVGDTCLSIPKASLFHFGVLMSEMHIAWVKYTCGRLESRFRYSGEIVYNNYPWPFSPSEKKIKQVEEKAKKVLDAVDLCYSSQQFKTEMERIEYLFDLYTKYIEN